MRFRTIGIAFAFVATAAYFNSQGMFLRKLAALSPKVDTKNARYFVTKAASAASTMSNPASPVITVPHGSLHVSKPTWWLESRFHFAFADYYDPARENFGHLRVLNDDLVKGQSGFGTHPHRDAEIFSYIVDGELSHADSMGNKESLGKGCVQYLSAGTGIRHSEMNDGVETCRFLQIWLTPDARGHKPQYGSTSYTKADRHNTLLHILGGTGSTPEWYTGAPSSIHLHQDSNMFVSESDPGTEFHLELCKSRMAYLVAIEGSLTVNGVDLKTRDGSKLMGSHDSATALDIKVGPNGAHFLIIELVKTE